MFLLGNRTPHWQKFAQCGLIFPRKITFRGKFREISWKKDFSKVFPRKIPFFPNIFGGKFSAEFSPKFSREKMNEKSAPARLLLFSPSGASAHVILLVSFFSHRRAHLPTPFSSGPR
jgi:hypothetical protein